MFHEQSLGKSLILLAFIAVVGIFAINYFTHNLGWYGYREINIETPVAVSIIRVPFPEDDNYGRVFMTTFDESTGFLRVYHSGNGWYEEVNGFPGNAVAGYEVGEAGTIYLYAHIPSEFGWYKVRADPVGARDYDFEVQDLLISDAVLDGVTGVRIDGTVPLKRIFKYGDYVFADVWVGSELMAGMSKLFVYNVDANSLLSFDGDEIVVADSIGVFEAGGVVYAVGGDVVDQDIVGWVVGVPVEGDPSTTPVYVAETLDSGGEYFIVSSAALPYSEGAFIIFTAQVSESADGGIRSYVYNIRGCNSESCDNFEMNLVCVNDIEGWVGDVVAGNGLFVVFPMGNSQGGALYIDPLDVDNGQCAVSVAAGEVVPGAEDIGNRYLDPHSYQDSVRFTYWADGGSGSAWREYLLFGGVPSAEWAELVGSEEGESSGEQSGGGAPNQGSDSSHSSSSNSLGGGNTGNVSAEDSNDAFEQDVISNRRGVQPATPTDHGGEVPFSVILGILIAMFVIWWFSRRAETA